MGGYCYGMSLRCAICKQPLVVEKNYCTASCEMIIDVTPCDCCKCGTCFDDKWIDVNILEDI